MSSILSLHTSVESALSLAGLGTRVVSKSWKQTANQTGKERHVIIPLECVTAPELDATPFHALVESALMLAAETVLRDHVNAEGDSCFEIPLELFNRPNLIETFMGRDQWLSKGALDLAFTQSATWKRITSRHEFKSSRAYQKAADAFRSDITKLSGRAVRFSPDRCDMLIAKLEESDFNTEFGSFVIKRLNQIKTKQGNDEYDISAL